jgi:hydrogenase expression/formation protein HypC
MCLGRMGVVTKVWEEGGVPLALVNYGSAVETACLLAIPGIEVGASVLVHLGFAVEVLDPRSVQEAERLREEAMAKEERS